jgi:carboxymethylenebutenolidase
MVETVETEEVRFPADAGHMMRARFLRPAAAGGPWPGLIVLHEAVGLDDPGIRQIAERFAEAGYVVLAPDLFERGPAILCMLRMMRSLQRGEGQGFRDLEAARRWLIERSEVDASRVGVAGFCLGGGFAILYAVRARVDVVAAFYGLVPKEADDLRGICPVVAGYGEKDWWFAERGRRLQRHLEQLGVPHDVKFYPDAGHAFMDRPKGLLASILAVSPLKVGHNEEACRDSWARIFRFFDKHLGQEPSASQSAKE